MSSEKSRRRSRSRLEPMPRQRVAPPAPRGAAPQDIPGGQQVSVRRLSARKTTSVVIGGFVGISLFHRNGGLRNPADARKTRDAAVRRQLMKSQRSQDAVVGRRQGRSLTSRVIPLAETSA